MHTEIQLAFLLDSDVLPYASEEFTKKKVFPALKVVQSDSDPLKPDFLVAGKTAISRTKVSAPLSILLKTGLIQGQCLNFGKGKANLDTQAMTDSTGIECKEYDFVHAPITEALTTTYDSVYVAYVLNVLPIKARQRTLRMVKTLIGDNGSAMFAVRSVSDQGIKNLMLTAPSVDDGYRTSIGTFQKGYTSESLKDELSGYFTSIEMIKTPSGFELAICKS